MEIEKSKFKSYGFTLRRTTNPGAVDIYDYKKHLERLPWHSYSNVVYEYKSGLHAHGVAVILRATDLKRFRFRGWHLHLVELWDPQQWDLYLNKDQSEPTPDMVDTPKEEDFVPPTKRMFPIKQMTGGNPS